MLGNILGSEKPSDKFVRECGRRMYEKREGVDPKEALEEEERKKNLERSEESESEDTSTNENGNENENENEEGNEEIFLPY